MYQVVVCSNCRYVWIVKDRPKTSQCGKCRKTRKMKKLKKYHETDDKDEAKIARAFYHAQVKDQGERFERAHEKGLLVEDMGAFLDENEYLETLGVDTEEVEKTVYNLLSSHDRKSEVDIIKNAFWKLDNPDLEDFLEYTRGHGVSDENAVIILEGLIRNGTISDSGEIKMSNIEERIDEIFDDSSVTQRQSEEDTSGGSHHDIILRAVEEHGDDSVNKILDYATDRGMDEQKAVIKLEKMTISGQVNPGIGQEDISEKRTSILDGPDAEVAKEEAASSYGASTNAEENDSDGRTGLSQREILEKAIEEQDQPTEDDVIEFALEHGMAQKKAQRFLKKMRQHGDITQRADSSLRLM